ncbi:hypothetical protein BASA50_007800 [Batrachochytrium salamandrivorans]|uniref:3-oxo-5-alpha-steroid 4-dehydrogenase C-terminal domain-containing protein n=1 Tax=Batrachochytrium salamandrivorans TaxID=1357716 RepID=A0ABQ8F608_9FUNG|nr:hypothetical protein BASA50_007800 [Batrachochytrium salamandrivorans]
MDVIIWTVRAVWTIRTCFLLASAAVLLLATCTQPVLVSMLHYGKTLSSCSPSLPPYTVPKAWFSHFYLVATVWTSCLGICLGLLHLSTTNTNGTFTNGTSTNGTSTIDSVVLPWHIWLVWLLVETQAVRRWIECMHWQTPCSTSRMHLLHYLVGIAFYIGMPVALLLEQSLTRASFISNKTISIYFHSPVDDSFFSQLVWTIMGVGMFAWASVEQHRIHAHLALLRKKMDSDRSIGSIKTIKPTGSIKTIKSIKSIKPIGSIRYPLPCGSWFRFVACPHYLFEIIIYASFVILSGMKDGSAWTVLIWVTCDLAVSANLQWNWYKKIYPTLVTPSWKRLIPLIY